MIKALIILLLLNIFSASHSFQSSKVIRASLSLLKMSSTELPDVSRFMKGDRAEGTKDYIMQQTMIRVKDPIKSLEFYCDVLGFKLIMYREFPKWRFNVYFIAPVNADDIPEGEQAQWVC
jgi:hypothetical protein